MADSKVTADFAAESLNYQEISKFCSACDCRKINLEGSTMDGSTDTFAGFEGGNLKNSSWQVASSIYFPFHYKRVFLHVW